MAKTDFKSADDGRDPRSARNSTKVLAGLVVFTLTPIAYVLLAGKGAWQGKLLVAAILGAAGATAFIMLYGLLRLARNSFKTPPAVPLEEGEGLLHAAPANHYVGLASHGGMLRITTHRLLFLPHRFNFTVQPVIIRWAEVDGIAFDDTTGYILLKAAAAAVAHMHVSSRLLSVRHGAIESRFVINLTPTLGKSILSAATIAHQARMDRESIHR